MDPLVYILLATYNGEKYIERQLDSIIAQTYSNWRLLIRDDGSEDRTISIVKQYIKTDDRIEIVDEQSLNKGNGACQNFAALLGIAISSNASLIMFCDQDDHWFVNKVQLITETIIKNNADMVYSNFLYGDANLNQLPESVQQSKSPYIFPLFKNLMVQNHVYGCTMMITHELARKCWPIPLVAENHDYWITLVAAGVNAKIYHLKKALMLYRQHDGNVTGSFADHDALPRVKRFLFNFEQLKEKEAKKISMLKAFYVQLNTQIRNEHQKLLTGYFRSLEKGRASIIFYCIKNKIKRQSLLSTAVLYMILYKLSQQKK